METESFTISTELPAPPERVYAAWLDSAQHAAMTGGAAQVDPCVGGKHSAWDGYIRGEILALVPGKQIVQSWRTRNFPKRSPDSRLEVRLEPSATGTHLTLVHTGIPVGQGKRYEPGWQANYFEPMADYFASLAAGEALASATSRRS